MMRPADVGKLQPGAAFTEWGYLSTTTESLNAYTVAHWRRDKPETRGRSPVVFKILAPSGTHAAVAHVEEQEVLLGRGRRMRVVDVLRPTRSGDARTVTAELLPESDEPNVDVPETPRSPRGPAVPDEIVGDPTLTIRQKRARLRKLGLSEDQINDLVPLAFARRSDDPGFVDDDDDEVYDWNDVEASTEPIEDIERAIGNQLKHYWTKGEGLAKWATRPHPWTALYRHLLKYVGSARAKRIASQWFKEVFGIWPGERKGDNPAGPG